MNWPLEAKSLSISLITSAQNCRIVEFCHYFGVILLTAPFLKMKTLSGKCNTPLKGRYFYYKISYVPSQKFKSEIKSDTSSPVVSLVRGREGSFSPGSDVQDITCAIIPDNFNLNLSTFVNEAVFQPCRKDLGLCMLFCVMTVCPVVMVFSTREPT